MNKVLHGKPLQRFWNNLHALYLASLCCFILQSIAGAWKESWCCHSLCRILGKAPAHLTSRIRRGLRRVNQWLETHGQRLTSLLQESFFCRIYRAVFRTFRNSRLLGWLFAGGTAGVLLFLIGGYVVWDWLLRDVLSVPVLSSFWDELLMLLCFVWLVYQRMSRQHRLDVCDTPLDMPVVFFLVVCILLLVMQFYYPSINIAGFRATTQYILWFFVVTRLIRDDRDFTRLYGVMVVIASLIGLHGIYQYIVGAPIPSNWVDHAEASVRTRVYSIFSSCNIMGD